MAVTLQDRLNKLGLKAAQPMSPMPQSSQVIPRWQQELDHYKQQQHELEHQQHQVENTKKSDRRSQQNQTVSDPNSGQRIETSTSSKSHLQANSESSDDEIVFLPKGRAKTCSSKATNESGEDEYESETEPVSSTADPIGAFCLFSQVTKLPYKYLKDPKNDVSVRFFSQGKAFQRTWLLYSINAPGDMGGKPIFFVPHNQVDSLINEINADLQTHIRVPPYPFTINFYNDGMPKPIYLGIVNSKDDLNRLKSSVPDLPPNYAELPVTATTKQKDDYESWREKIERALAVESKKKSTVKQRKREHQVKIAVEHNDQLKRIQRYFGLRPPLPDATVLQPGGTISCEQLKLLQNLGVVPEVLNGDKPVKHPFEDQTVILAVDVESWEEYHAMITEVGISTLDTAELVNIPPGHQGENWIQHIRSRHFRIRGREHMRNVKYCIGDPESFKFGQSELVDISDASNAVDSCFEWPFSAEDMISEPPIDGNEIGVIGKDEPGTSAAQRRNLLLIGHDILGDIEYLAQLGSEIFSIDKISSQSRLKGLPSRRQTVLSSIRERLDTATIHKVLTGDENPRSLAKVCYDLDITAWHPHNAGNDARYTLEAFVKLAIKARQQDDTAVAEAKEINSFNAYSDIRQLESELKVQAKLQAARDAIAIDLRGR